MPDGERFHLETHNPGGRVLRSNEKVFAKIDEEPFDAVSVSNLHLVHFTTTVSLCLVYDTSGEKQAGITPIAYLFVRDHGVVVHHQVHVVVHIVLVVDLLAHREALRVVRLRAARLFHRERQHMDRATDWTRVRVVARVE